MKMSSKNTSAAVAAELHRITGVQPSPLLISSVMDIALGDMPGPTPSPEIHRTSPGDPRMFSPDEAVAHAFDTKLFKGRSAPFLLQIGHTCNKASPSKPVTIGASGALLIVGAAGVGKNAIARYLLQQYLGNNWSPLALPVPGSQGEWAGFATVVDQNQALTKDLPPSHGEQQWHALDNIAKSLARQPESFPVRPVLVADGLRVKYGSLRQIPPILARHQGALICIEQRLEHMIALERLPTLDGEIPGPVFQTVLHLAGNNQWLEGRDGRPMMAGVLWRWTAMSNWWQSDRVYIDALPRPDGRDERAARALYRALTIAGLGVSVSHSYNLVALARRQVNHHHVTAAAR